MNKFVSFLENFGLMVLRGFNLIPQATQIVESSAGQPIPVLDKLGQIWNLVKTGEVIIGKVMGPGSGEQKASGIAPLVAQVVMSSEIVAGRTIAADKLDTFNAKCQELGGIVADIGNCLEPDSTAIQTEKIPAPKPPMGVVVPAAQLAAAAAPASPTVSAPKPTPAAAAILAALSEAPGMAAALVAGLPED